MRSFFGLLTAQAISMIGSRMSMVALPWFVFATTGSPGKTGLVAAAEMLPYVLTCALGGPALDRLGLRRVSIVADVLSALAVAAIPLLHTRGLTFEMLVVLVAAAGLLRGFGDSAKRALFPQIVKASKMDMTRAASVNDGISRLSTLLGAPIAGLLIAAFDAPSVLLIDAGTFAFGGLAVLLAVRATHSQPAEREPYFQALGGGMRFLRRDTLMAGLTFILFCTNMFDAAMGSVLLPMWARDVIGSPVVLGTLFAIFALGAVLGNIGFTAVAPKVPRFMVFAVGFLLAGAPRFIIMVLTDELWIIYAIAFMSGLAAAALNPILSALAYERVPEPMQARVFGLSMAASWAGIPLGALLGGMLADVFSLNIALLVLGGGYLAVTLMPFMHPMWRQMDVKPVSSSDRELVLR